MILLLSDLHLPGGASPLRDGFIRVLDGPARQAEAVYILGDLFEIWVGDDIGLQEHAEEVTALKRLTALRPVYFIAGNRDFLIGRRFAQASGVQRLPDPVVRTLGGVPTLLSHGDRYCSDDRAYQRWRRFSRNRFAQWLYGLLPRARRLKIAAGLRARSQHEQRDKPMAILDVNEAAIVAAMNAHGVRRMIHGHTHRPDDHRPRLDEGRGERIVLADWRPERMEYLLIGDDGRPVRHRLD